MLTRKTQMKPGKRKPKRSQLQKRKDKVSSPYWRKKAMAAWSKLVRLSFCNKCAICGESPCEAHHIIPRSRHANEQNPMNGIALCASHHKWSNVLSAHGAPMAFAEWLQKNRPEQWEWICEHKFDICQKPDYKLRYEQLATMLEAGHD